MSVPDDGFEQIAVIGMAARYPDAPDVDQFWQNLRNGVHSLRRFSDEELEELGIPSEIYKHPNFVPTGTLLPDADKFDAAFFGFTPREAEGLDPQARVFLETCYSALEHAAYDPFRYRGAIGVFAGSNPHDYAVLLGRVDREDPAGAMDRLIGTDKDFIATRVSHRLNLRGPALNIQTACSTSLVSVHVACQSLLSYESDMVLAGGVGITFRHGVGYFYQQGVILSPDGVCRAFDAAADGTVLGQGCGVVVLKRLSEAIVDGDTIHAVIKATAINNDGSDKVSFSAPREVGQADVIATAQSLAGVTADDITFVETHGTGTSLGDPIEIAALTRAFSQTTDRREYCALGAVKTNVGHTDAAAGITGFIKTVLSLEHAEIPPTLHFEKPNPNIDFANSPFFVNTELRPWETGGQPRRAGVSSFGIGGTNAHAILEEAPFREASGDGRSWHLLTLSAKTNSALADAAAGLGEHLENNPELSLADVAYTLNVGRSEFEHRAVSVVDSVQEAAAALKGTGSVRKTTGQSVAPAPDVVFMFPGGGAQYPQMARELYETEGGFRNDVDRCAEILEPHLGFDLRTLLFPDPGAEQEAAEQLERMSLSMPALGTIEYSLARLLMSWGIQPAALLGHSTGQYPAAILAGVFTLEDGLGLLATRGKLMESTKPGAMLAVGAAAERVGPFLGENVELAGINSPQSTVVSGEVDAIDALAVRLEANGIESQRLRLTHASHCWLMEPIMDAYEAKVRSVVRQRPTIPMLSDSNGTWLTDEEATDPAYWAAHLRRTVQFGDCIDELIGGQSRIFLEVGPGRALSTLVRQNDQWSPEIKAITTIRHPSQPGSDLAVALEAVGRLWAAGVELDWEGVYAGQRRHRIPLPTYPFEREHFWAPAAMNLLAVDPHRPASDPSGPPTGKEPIDDWYYVPSWHRGGPAIPTATSSWLVFANQHELSKRVLQALTEGEESVRVVRPGAEFDRVGSHEYVINPAEDSDYQRLMAALSEEGGLPDAVIHMWMANPHASSSGTEEELRQSLDLGVHSILGITRALARQDATRTVRLELVTTGCHSVMGTEQIRPEAAAMLGPCKVIPLEYNHLACRAIDLSGGAAAEEEVSTLIAELRSASIDPVVSIRGRHRWLHGVERIHLPSPSSDELPLKKGGVYLIVDGLEGVGLSLATYLAENYGAKLALQGRPRGPDPVRVETDGKAASRVEALARVEAAATEVMVLHTDLLNENEMRKAVGEAEASLGPIDGVVVASAVVNDVEPIDTLTRESFERMVRTRIIGSLVIDRIFAERPLDFIVFSSSLGTMLYHSLLSQVGYVTANSFVEAFPQRRGGTGTPMTTVAWDNWLHDDMVRASLDFADPANFVTSVESVHSISPEEAMVVFERSLSSGYPQIYISTTDLAARVEQDVDVGSLFLAEALSTTRDYADLPSVESGGVAAAIADIWRDLLGYEAIAEDDDFFALGGDSLQIARMAGRLSHAFGVTVPVSVIFEAPTIGRLAELIDSLVHDSERPATPRRDQEVGIGPVPLTPNLCRFLDRHSLDVHHWNVSLLLTVPSSIDLIRLTEAATRMMLHHDALRLRFAHDEDDGWRQWLAEPADYLEIPSHDLAGLVSEDQDERLTAITRRLHEEFDLESGPLLRMAHFDLGPRGHRLFVVLHHFVGEGVSLGFMLEDLETAYNQLRNGEDVTLPAKTTSVREWAESLNEAAQSPEIRGDLDYWLSLPWSEVRPFPRELDGRRSDNTNASTQVVSVSHSLEETSMFLRKRGGVSSEELLLSSLAWALADRNSDFVHFERLGHGRLPALTDIDLSRTSGFLLSYTPMVLRVPDRTPNPDALDQVVSQIRENIARGLSFDLLRWMSEDETITDALSKLPRPQLSFNFLSRINELLRSDSMFSTAPETDLTAHNHSPRGLRYYTISVVADIEADLLTTRFVYSDAFHHRDTIEALAERYQKGHRRLLALTRV